jgi:hypothetical protein
MLGIEEALKTSANSPFFSKYDILRRDLFSREYQHWCSRFAFGNDHGAAHIERVLEKLDFLLGPAPLTSLNVYELFLTMVAILYHDIGILRGRDQHNVVSGLLLEAEQCGRLLNSDDKELIVAAVVSHSSSADIGKECGGWNEEHPVGGYLVRPRTIAALVRLADELDEDKRRADSLVQSELQVPDESRFYWEFCQRISGIVPRFETRDIDIAVKLEEQDLGRPVVVAGRPGSFIGHFARKLQKINHERQLVNAFLPERVRYAQLSVTVRAPSLAGRRTVVLNDTTSDRDFVAALPELTHERCRLLESQAIGHIRRRQFDEGLATLAQLNAMGGDVPLHERLKSRYLSACAESLRAANGPDDPALDRALQWLREWLNLNIAESWDHKDPGFTIEKMFNDGDLSRMLEFRANAVRTSVPQELRSHLRRWPRGSGGCVARGMPVTTPGGLVGIEHLQAGDTVVSLDPATLEPVNAHVKAAMGPMRRLCCLCINDALVVSPEQPLLSSGGVWLPAASLKEGDMLVDEQGRERAIVSIDLAGEHDVFDVITDHETHTYVASGYVCHNKMPEPPI